MEKIGIRFEGDLLASVHYLESIRRSRFLEPEKELMLAVLADAVECFGRHSGSRDVVRMRIFQEAQDWLFSDDEKEPFSFLNLCDALELDPGYIRRGVLNWKWRNQLQRKYANSGQTVFHLKPMKRNLHKSSRRLLNSPVRGRRPSRREVTR